MAEEAEAATTDAEEVDLDAIVDKWESELFESAEGEQAKAESESPKGAAEEEERQAKESDVKSIQTEAATTEDKEEGSDKEEKPKAKALAAIAKREAELRQKEQELKEREEKHSKFQNLEQRFASDPVGFLKELGVKDFASVANQLWYHELGDDAPAEFQEKAKQASIEARIKALEAREDALRQEAENAKQQAAYQAQVAAVDRDIQTFVREVPKDMPFLARLAGDNEQQAYEAMCQVAAAAIQAGNYPSARQVAKLLDDQFKSDYEYWKGLDSNSETTQDTTDQRATKRQSPKTLSSADKAQRPSREPEGVLSDEDYQERGIRAAEKLGLFT